MLVILLVKFRNKDCKTTELGLLLQVLPVRIVTFVETLGSHLKKNKHDTCAAIILFCQVKFVQVLFSVLTTKQFVMYGNVSLSM